MTVPETPSADQPCDVVYAGVKELGNCIEVGPRKRIARMTGNRNTEHLIKIHNGSSILFGNGDSGSRSSSACRHHISSELKIEKIRSTCKKNETICAPS